MLRNNSILVILRAEYGFPSCRMQVPVPSSILLRFYSFYLLLKWCIKPKYRGRQDLFTVEVDECLSLLSSIGSILFASENISSAEFMDSSTFNLKSNIAINPKSKAFGIWRCGIFLISFDPCPYCEVPSFGCQICIEMNDIVNPLTFHGDRFVTRSDRMERWDKGVMGMKVFNYSALSGMESWCSFASLSAKGDSMETS